MHHSRHSCPYWQSERTAPQVTVAVSPHLSARELELEDRQSRLQQELRERMAVEGKRRANEWEGDVGHCPRPYMMPLATRQIT